MPVPNHDDWFRKLHRAAYYAVQASIWVLLIGSFVYMMHDVGHHGRHPVWMLALGALVKAAGCGLLGGLAWGVFITPFVDAYAYIKPDGNWTYWLVTKEGVIPAPTGRRYWFSDKDNLIGIAPAMELYQRFLVADQYIHTFAFKVTFRGTTSAEIAAKFWNWYQELSSHRGNPHGMEAFLERSYERADLPFTVSRYEAAA